MITHYPNRSFANQYHRLVDTEAAAQVMVVIEPVG